MRLPFVKLRTALIVVGAILVVAFALSRGFGRSSPQTFDPPIAIEVARADVVRSVSGTARIQPGEKRTVRSGVSGTVAEVLVSESETVRQGQDLILLRKPDLSTQIQESKSKLEDARAKLANALNMPWRDAMALDVGPVFEFTAPDDGRIEGLDLAEGVEIKKGDVVAHVVGDRTLRFKAQVTSSEAECLEKGQDVILRPEGYAGEISGTVQEVSQKPSAGTTTFWHEVIVTVANPGLLGGGQNGVVAFDGPQGVNTERPGKFEWEWQRWIKSPLSGVVEEVMVHRGQRVSRGDALASVRNEGFPNEIAALKLAVEQAEAALAAKQDDLAKLKVASPIGGVIASLQVGEGDRIAEDAVLAEIHEIGVNKAVLPVDELDISLVELGQPAQVRVDAVPGRIFRGEVTSVAAVAQVQSGIASYDVTIELEPSEQVRPGMTANVTIVIARREGVLAVPIECVQYRGDKPFVQVVREDGTTEDREIVAGLKGEMNVEVVRGLTEGERVAVSWSSEYRQGVPGPVPVPGGGVRIRAPGSPR